jgi:hypothetical protein
MNDRYRGEGPLGKTKKSAASAKPVKEAASSVRVKKEPVTASEKKAARRAREKEMERKAAERKRKQAAKAEGATGSATPIAPEPPPKKGFLSSLTKPAPNMPTDPRYKMLRKRYWIMIAIGIVAIAASWLLQMYAIESPAWMVAMGAAYVCVIGALILDFSKIRPMVKAHQAGASVGPGGKSPKQLKHEAEAAEAAAALEAAKRAKKSNRSLFRSRSSANTDAIDAEIVEAEVEAEAEVEPEEGEKNGAL